MLDFSRAIHISHLQVAGDSKMVIGWELQGFNLQVRSLNGWKWKIRSLQVQFDEIKFLHMYREFNILPDRLSKHSLEVDEGTIFFELLKDYVGYS